MQKFVATNLHALEETFPDPHLLPPEKLELRHLATMQLDKPV
jgi:hypothetical protein